MPVAVAMPDRYHFDLPADLTAPGHARARLPAALGERLPARVLRDACLVLSELVANAVVHGAGRVQATASVHGERLRLEVADEGHGAPAIDVRGGGERGGWGLRIVDAVATR